MESTLQSTPFVTPTKYTVLINKIIKGTRPTSFGKMCHLQVKKNVSFEKTNCYRKAVIYEVLWPVESSFLTLSIKGTTVNISF
jgi:hypothetical protein